MATAHAPAPGQAPLIPPSATPPAPPPPPLTAPRRQTAAEMRIEMREVQVADFLDRRPEDADALDAVLNLPRLKLRYLVDLSEDTGDKEKAVIKANIDLGGIYSFGYQDGIAQTARISRWYASRIYRRLTSAGTIIRRRCPTANGLRRANTIFGISLDWLIDLYQRKNAAAARAPRQAPPQPAPAAKNLPGNSAGCPDGQLGSLPDKYLYQSDDDNGREFQKRFSADGGPEKAGKPNKIPYQQFYPPPLALFNPPVSDPIMRAYA